MGAFEFLYGPRTSDAKFDIFDKNDIFSEKSDFRNVDEFFRAFIIFLWHSRI